MQIVSAKREVDEKVVAAIICSNTGDSLIQSVSWGTLASRHCASGNKGARCGSSYSRVGGRRGCSDVALTAESVYGDVVI